MSLEDDSVSSIPAANEDLSTAQNYNDNDTEYLHYLLSTGFLNKLSEKKSDTDSLFSTLYLYLGDALFNDERIITALYKHLGMRRYRFLLRLNRFMNGKRSHRGKTGLSIEKKQLIRDCWIEYSQVTVDRRNERDMVSMPKQKYQNMYGGIETEKLIQVVNKRGIEIVKAVRRVATITVRNLVNNLITRDHVFSYGTVINFRPFFIGVATEPEKLECLCRVCFNMRLLFDTIMKAVKEENLEEFKSITEYLKSGGSCKFGRSGYTALECITGDCNVCQGILNPAKYRFPNKKKIKYYQYESVKTVRTTEGGEAKEGSRTERVEYETTIKKCRIWILMAKSTISTGMMWNTINTSGREY